MRSSERLNVTPSEGIAIQRRLSLSVRRRFDGRRLRLVAGTDVHFPAAGTARAVVAVFTYPELEIVERAVHEGPCVFPYIPGLLSFREIPPLLEAWRSLSVEPDFVLCDGQGIAHPRGLGLASHFGLLLGVPSVGCAKSPLFGAFKDPRKRRGSTSPITAPDGKTIGAVLRTRDGVRPLYVSIGHLMSLEKALELVLVCAPRFRLPEPIREAHRIASANLG